MLLYGLFTHNILEFYTQMTSSDKETDKVYSVQI